MTCTAPNRWHYDAPSFCSSKEKHTVEKIMVVALCLTLSFHYICWAQRSAAGRYASFAPTESRLVSLKNQASIRARVFLEAPSIRSERTSKSRETVGSPASILATLDWLDFSIRAS